MNSALCLIRDMRESDIPGLLEIERVSFPAPWSEGMFKSQLRLGDIAVNIVLAVDKTVIGYMVAWVAFDEIHILSIAVAPEERRKGYAGKIMDAVIRRGRSMGVSRVILEVRAGNVAARNFYDRLGFKIVGERKRYYSETGEDAVMMEFKIDE